MSTASAADLILRAIAQTAGLYSRLVLLVLSPADQGAVLRAVAAHAAAPLLNLNLELSRRLLERSRQQRSLDVHSLLEELLAAAERDTVLLAHLELLFEPSLAQEPLRLLQQLSRGRTLVVAWPGRVEAGYLLYAEPGHPEYRRYPAHDLTLVDL